MKPGTLGSFFPFYPQDCAFLGKTLRGSCGIFEPQVWRTPHSLKSLILARHVSLWSLQWFISTSTGFKLTNAVCVTFLLKGAFLDYLSQDDGR